MCMCMRACVRACVCVHGMACAWRSELVISFHHGFQGLNRLPGFHGRCFYPWSHFVSLRNRFSKGLRMGKEPSVSDGTQSWAGGLLADPCLSLQREGIPDGECSEDTDCRAGESVVAGHGEGLEWLGLEQGKETWTGRSMALPRPSPAGLKTGRCLRVGNSTQGTCEIFAWCPVETMSMPT